MFMPGLLGITLTLFIGCFAHGADIKLALVCYLATINVITLFAFMCDKGIAADYPDLGGGGWRFAEVGLYFLMFAGGPVGAWLGMILTCHKLKKASFLCCGFAFTVLSLGWVFLWLIITAEDNLSTCYKYQKSLSPRGRGNSTGIH